jgi:uncharacterized membrane protein
VLPETTPPHPNQRHWLLLSAVLCAAAFSFWFLRRDAANYLALIPENYTPYYWPRRYGLLLHIGGGTVALLTGLIQVYLGLSGKTKALHRRIGQLYVGGVAAGALGACYLAASFPPPRDVLYSSGLVGLGITWVITTSMAYAFVRRGNLFQHRAWMLRSYVVTFGFVTLRVVEACLMSLGVSEDTSVGIAAWLCWTVPLLIAEPLIRSPRWLTMSAVRGGVPAQPTESS